MGQFSMVIYTPPGSLLSGNQQSLDALAFKAFDQLHRILDRLDPANSVVWDCYLELILKHHDKLYYIQTICTYIFLE